MGVGLSDRRSWAAVNEAGFQPCGVGGLVSWGFAPGWYERGPLALNTSRGERRSVGRVARIALREEAI